MVGRLKERGGFRISSGMGVSGAEIEAVYRERAVSYRNALAAVTGSHDSAYDALQEGFARALAARARFRGGSFEAWLWRILLNAALEQQRRGRRRPRLEQIEIALPEQGRDPALDAAISSLAPRQRLIVFLRYFADLSYADIAAVLGVAEGTVAATLSQAHAALRAALLDTEVTP